MVHVTFQLSIDWFVFEAVGGVWNTNSCSTDPSRSCLMALNSTAYWLHLSCLDTPNSARNRSIQMFSFFLGRFFCIAFSTFGYRQRRSLPLANALLFPKRKTCFGGKMRCLLREALKEFWNFILHSAVSTARWKLNGRHAKTLSITVFSRCRNRRDCTMSPTLRLTWDTLVARSFATLRSLAKQVFYSSSILAMFDGIGWKRRSTVKSKQILA